MILFIQLLLAHLIGDFILQPNSWVIAKEHKKIRAYQLYLHALIHALLILLLTGNWRFWPWALLLSIIHLLIDITKITFQKEENKRAFFFYDQAAHLISIILIWVIYTQFNFEIFNEHKVILLTQVTFILLLTVPSSIFIKLFISKWTPYTEDKKDDSLQSAGKYIGYLERILVFVFIILNHWEAVGFLITAKSVFRFGDLKASKDRKLTEYVLIGTLLSFGIAIFAGIAFKIIQQFSA